MIARVAVDAHLSPADLMHLPVDMLDAVIDEWVEACRRATVR